MTTALLIVIAAEGLYLCLTNPNPRGLASPWNRLRG